VALLHALLGLVAIRESRMLVDLDAELLSSASVEELERLLVGPRIVLVLTALVAIVLTFRWLPSAARTMRSLIPERERVSSGLGVLLQPAGVPPQEVSWSAVRVGSGRRLAFVAAVTTVVAAVIGAVSAIALITAGDLDTVRAAKIVAGADAGLWIVATLLLGAVASNIGWRIAAAGRAIGVFAPLSDAPGRVVVRLAPALLIFTGLVPIAATPAAVAAVDCPGTRLTCGSIVVPVTHGAGPDQATISVVYGVHPATGPRHGTLVVAVGGPGASGLESADSRLEGFSDELLDRYDIVFWDQRGIGNSDGHNCPVAGGIYSGVGSSAESARDFVDACLREAEVGQIDLTRYSTSQAAEDLEAIRARLGADRFVLYGESYGTELAQIYAAAHPDRLAGLILDGAVDLTLTANDFWSAAAHSFDDTLGATFRACEADRACRADLANPSAAYDRLLARLDAAPIVANYADLTGVVSDHSIDQGGVEGAVSVMLYEPVGRSLILRALAASEAGDNVPLARLLDLFGPGINPFFSTFAYHAILCADYRVSPTADVADVDAVLEYGRETGALATRMADVYYAQVPCLYWPVQPPSAERPAPVTALAAPILVLGAELDPITPIQFGRAIAGRAANGYLVETSGGPHVTFGRGIPCVDEVVEAFLLEDVVPGSRLVRCDDVAVDRYIPLTPLDVDDYDDAMDAMASVEDEIFADPFYSFWEGTGTIQIGCRYGGYVTIASTDNHDAFTFGRCEMAAGMPLDGTGGYDLGQDVLTFDVTFPGGSLKYTSGAERSVTGEFRGRSVDEGD
jgi:pimeloyl-ACP methyl ester carboxylesterase